MNFKKLKLPIALILATTLPFLLLLTKVDWSLWSTDKELFEIGLVAVAANMFGFIGIMILYWQFILGSRFIAKYLSRDILELNKLHQWLGKYGFLLVILHPMLERMNYVQSMSWPVVLNFSSELEKHVSFGRIAYMSFAFVWITSFFLRKRLKFRPWLYIHYITYPALLILFLHALDIGRYIAEYSFLKYMWIGMGIAYVFILIMRIVHAFGYLKPRYKLVSKENIGEDVIKVTFAPVNKALTPIQGQYAYLQLKRFGESHPFTIMDFDQDSGRLTFGIKKIGKHSKAIDALEQEQEVFVDGPYGEFTLEGHNDKPKVVIAGGIGITPFVRLLKDYGDQNSYLLYANRIKADIVEHDLFKNADINYTSYLSREESTEDDCIKCQRLDKDAISSFVPSEVLLETNFFLCGSQRFLEGAKSMLSELGIEESRIFVEEFTS